MNVGFGGFGSVVAPFLVAVAVAGQSWAVAPPARLAELARSGEAEAIRAMGPGVLPELVALYERSTVSERATLAYVFYQLGWKSEEAKRALLADAHTEDRALRLQAQWALGRVSDDPAVVDVLLENMRRDPVPLFRDKAACALANDQIHLSPAQKVRLFEGLIAALDDPVTQVRAIAIQALGVLTGQRKGFVAGAPPETRQAAVAKWNAWLDDYRAHL